MPRQFRRIKLAAAAALVILVMYGHTMPGEQIMRHVATAAQVVVKKAIAAVKD
jgi:methenyltetrahydromethanopterin cyclohydrolase